MQSSVSPQLASVQALFAAEGWHCEVVPGREVLHSGFDAQHTRMELIAQVFPELNALSVVAEVPMPLDPPRRRILLELLARANKELNFGSLEYDLDRRMLVFRVTNLFERPDFPPETIGGMVIMAVTEMDRISPFAGVIRDTADAALPGLDAAELLLRDDLIPAPPPAENGE